MFNKKLKKEITDLQEQLQISDTTAGIYKTRLHKAVQDRNKLKAQYAALIKSYGELKADLEKLKKQLLPASTEPTEITQISEVVVPAPTVEEKPAAEKKTKKSKK